MTGRSPLTSAASVTAEDTDVAEDGRVTFDFDWNAQAEGARGVFDGNRMTVTYNLHMSLSDFEDGVYVFQPPAAAH